jgi:stage II sporulation SpoAA-like protein
VSVAWSISHPLRLVVIVVKGEVKQADFGKVLSSIDSANAGRYQKLVDITAMTSVLQRRTLRELADTVRRREAERAVGPIAIVAPSAKAQRNAKAFAMRARDERLIRVFPNQEEARRWLRSFYA